MSKVTTIVALAGMLVFGFIIGAAGEPVPEKEVQIVKVPTDKVITKEVPVSNQDDLKRLKGIDDQIISVFKEANQACADGFEAASNLDIAGIEKTTDTFIRLTPVMQDLMNKRQNFIANNQL